MHTITTRPTRTTAFVREGMTSEDAMLTIGVKVKDLSELPCDLFLFSHLNDEMPEGTISWLSPSLMDGLDVFWRFVDAGILNARRSMRQTIEDMTHY